MIAPFLFTQKTEQKGWGVFTKEAISSNTRIELSPIVVMSGQEMKFLNQTKLHDYIFHWGNGGCCMALGLVPIYNHARPSNCEYFMHFEDELIEIKTMIPIEAGAQLTINYQGQRFAEDPDWFKVLP